MYCSYVSYLMSHLFFSQRAVFRDIRLPSLRLTHPTQRTASKAAPLPSSIPSPALRVSSKPPTSRHIPSYDASGGRLSPKRNQQLFAAKQLFEHGIRNVYTAPSHIGTLAFSWLIGVCFVGNSLRLLYERYDQLRPGHGLGTIKKTAVEAVNRLTMVFFTVAGGYAVLRYKGLIKSLDLVRVSGTIQLRISVRRLVPFLKPKEYIVPSYDLRLPYRWRFHSEQAADTRPPSTAGTVGHALGLPFRKFKEFLLKDGILAVNFEEGGRTALLDTNGNFTRSMGDLEAISEEVQPWDR